MGNFRMKWLRVASTPSNLVRIPPPPAPRSKTKEFSSACPLGNANVIISLGDMYWLTVDFWRPFNFSHFLNHHHHHIGEHLNSFYEHSTVTNWCIIVVTNCKERKTELEQFVLWKRESRMQLCETFPSHKHGSLVHMLARSRTPICDSHTCPFGGRASIIQHRCWCECERTFPHRTRLPNTRSRPKLGWRVSSDRL